jgi:hypothetical protein
MGRIAVWVLLLVSQGWITLGSTLAKREETALHTAIFNLDGYRIDRKFLSMTGPMKKGYELLNAPAGEPFVWVKSFSTEIVDPAGKPVSSKYLCHSWIKLPSDSAEGPRTARDGLLSISQGLPEMRFPEGFAMPMPNSAGARVWVLTQLLNNNAQIDQTFGVRMILKYLTDTDAKALGIKRLHSDVVAILRKDTVIPGAPSTAGNPSGDAMSGMMHHHEGMDEEGRPQGTDPRAAIDSTHFVVPPGDHTYTTTVPADSTFYRNAAIHFIKLHLHPYGHWIKLVDATTKQTLWTGNAYNDPQERAILKVDDYSSTRGIPIHKDHVYQVIANYQNPLKEDIDAMAVLRVYFGDDDP